MLRRLTWAVILLGLLAVPCEGHYASLSVGYRQFLPFQSLVAVQVVPAYSTVYSAPIGVTYPATPAYTYGATYALTAPAPCVHQAAPAPAPLPAPAPAPLAAPLPAAMPYAAEVGQLGVNAAYSPGYAVRARLFTPYSTYALTGVGEFLVRQYGTLRERFSARPEFAGVLAAVVASPAVPLGVHFGRAFRGFFGAGRANVAVNAAGPVNVRVRVR